MQKIPPLFLMLATICWPSTALAFVDPPRIVPQHPTSRTPIVLAVRAGNCHGFVADAGEPELILLEPGKLKFVAAGIASLEPGNPFCIYPVFDYRFDLGALPEGNYSLQLFIRDISLLGTEVESGSVSFAVSQPRSIPSSSWPALGAIVLALLLGGAILVRRHAMARPPRH